MKISSILATAAACALLASCSGKQGWSVSGIIADAPDSTKVAIEGFNAGRWYNIDSVSIAPDGKFSYTSPEGAPYPDVYRLGLNGRSIYFPVDSLDNIVITANGKAFDSGYQVDGSPEAKAITDIDRRIAEVVKAKGVTAALSDSLLKAGLNQAILDDSVGVVAFYVLNKSLGGNPLYSPLNRKDVAMLGATAQKFADLRPSDPRTKVLERQFIAARKAYAGKRVVEAGETGLFDISLYDEKGAERNLKSTAQGAGLTLLCFTSYAIRQSLPYNVVLNKLYEKHKAQGLKIYQVGFDTDEVAWRETAANLPWITVFCHADNSAGLIGSYNVTSMPMTYVINGNGDIVKRVENPSDLDSVVGQYLK